MHKHLLITLLLCLSFTAAHAQRDDREKARIERYEKDMQKKQAEYISDFVEELKVDDFQKEIISQKLHTYFETKKTILFTDIESFRRKELLEELDRTHFLGIKEMCTEEVYNTILEKIKGKRK
jgi:hypothetical protein